jgi:hypothetical protein
MKRDKSIARREEFSHPPLGVEGLRPIYSLGWIAKPAERTLSGLPYFCGTSLGYAGQSVR